MTTHPSKRPYSGSQPHITSYFPSQPSSTHQYNISSSTPTSPDDCSYEVKLPPAVQSNLLNVGMRVRKAVPEGYKVGNSYSGFALFSETTSHVSSQNISQTHNVPRREGEVEPRYPKTRPRAGARELTPFCGILKVGGMKNQQWGIYSPKDYGNDFIMGEDDPKEEERDWVPALSQDSTISNRIEEVHTPGGNKRRFLDEEEGDEILFGEAFLGGRENASPGERVLAVPRKKKWSGSIGGRIRSGQENSHFLTGREDDFQDAEFLDYGLVREVEMSG